MIFKIIHIFAWCVVVFIITDHSVKGSVELVLSTETSHGYEGMSLLLSCQVVKGQVQGHIEFVRPDGHIVMRCDNGSVSATCTTVVTGYTTVVTSYKTHAVHAAQYVMNITQFHSSVDVGMWLCRDSTANTPGASVNITSPSVYSITWNGLPQQKNYSDQYKMFVSGVCTVPQPKCDWSIKEVGKSKLKIPDTVKASALSVCDHEGFANCTLTFEKTPNAFLEKYLIFSVTISHPSIPDNLVTPEPTPVLFFPRVYLILNATNLIPPLGFAVNLVCTLIQEGRLVGTLAFFRRTSGRTPHNLAQVRQTAKGCANKVVPSGYDVVCGVGTDNLISHKKVYTLQINYVRREDYSYWYCYQFTAEKASEEIHLLQYGNITVILSASNYFPLINTTVNLTCSVYKHNTGHIEFYRIDENGNPERVGQAVQYDKRCHSGSSSTGYDVVCGERTEDVKSQQKEYSLVINAVQTHDYTSWYCYHSVANVTSSEISLEPPIPVNPERFVGGLGGAMMAVIIVSALMAAAVPAAASGAYYKRHRKQAGQQDDGEISTMGNQPDITQQSVTDTPDRVADTPDQVAVLTSDSAKIDNPVFSRSSERLTLDPTEAIKGRDDDDDLQFEDEMHYLNVFRFPV